MNHTINTYRRLAALLLLSTVATVPLASAQLSDFERPFGFARGEENRPFDPSTRDVNGNRLIVDGRIISGDDLSSFSSNGFGAGFEGQAFSGAGFLGQGQSTAIGNQLNVITQGSFNTVIVDSTQINNGDQTTVIGSQQRRPDRQPPKQPEYLNGELDLND